MLNKCFAMRVAGYGLQIVISSWNEHHIADKFKTFVLLCSSVI